jgi:arylsulfatase A-like enzyme
MNRICLCRKKHEKSQKQRSFHSRSFLCLLWIWLVQGHPAFGSRQSEMPNIVILLADDLGYGDLSIHGATDVQTPNIDALARGGAQFHEAYVCYPACGPSRAGLMTGRHHLRFGFPSNPDQVVPTEPGNLVGLPTDELTLAELLKEQGYATGLFGKWHLGFQPECHPLNNGFDEFFGFLGSLYRYFDLGNMKPPKCFMRGFERWHETEYQTDALARESASFIERHKDGPFLLFASFGAVHTPLMRDKDPGNVHVPLNGTDDPVENRRILVNMIEGLDRGAGTILQALEKHGLTEKTLVFFLSDNGGPEATGAYRNDPLRDFKGSSYEGGIRVPMFVFRPGHIEPGQSFQQPVSALDIVATSVAAAGGQLPSDRVYDSQNLLPVLAGEEEIGERPLFWDALGMQAVRLGDWKLVLKNGGRVRELYNIRNDTGEQNNLIGAYPERAADLEKRLRRWQGELPPWQFKWLPPAEYETWIKEHGELE